MSYQIKISSYHCLRLLIAITLNICFSYAIADDSASDLINQEEQHADNSEIGIEIGVLTTVGSDYRISYRKLDTPWIFGFRYLDTKEGFINDAAFGLTPDDSDQVYTKRTGLYVNYFLNWPDNESFYLSGALYNTTLRLECGFESDSDSAASIYFGGGYQGNLGNGFMGRSRTDCYRFFYWPV